MGMYPPGTMPPDPDDLAQDSFKIVKMYNNDQHTPETTLHSSPHKAERVASVK